MTFSYLWYDLETWGQDPAFSGIASFACQRTDSNLQAIDDPLHVFCQPRVDRIPHPDAVLVHRITPSDAVEKGINEYQFAHTIYEQFNTSNTCVVGFNSIRFDDEFCRYLFYHNLFDPYSHQWKNGCSRWDVLDVFRVCHVFKTDSLSWFTQNDVTSFSLQNLALANEVDSGTAHDALSDVQTTVQLARLLLQRQPKMFQYLFSHKSKKAVANFINRQNEKPFVHISGKLPSSQGNLAFVTILATDSRHSHLIHVVDLNSDIEPLLSLSVDELKELIFTPREQLPKEHSLPRIKTIHQNRCPVVLPASMLTNTIADRYNIDLKYCYHNLQLINSSRKSLAQKVRLLFDHPFDRLDDDVHAQLYNHLFTHRDQQSMELIHKTDITSWEKLSLSFSDERCEKLWSRLKMRHTTQATGANENEWNCYLLRLYDGKEHAAGIEEMKTLLQLRLREDRSDDDKRVLAATLAYLDKLERHSLELRAR